MALLRVDQNTLGAEHVFVIDAVEFYFLRWMLLTVLSDACLESIGLRKGRVGRGGHGQTS